MSATIHFGPEAAAPDNKKGRQAEACRPKDIHMLQIAETTDAGKPQRTSANSSEQEKRRLSQWLEARISASQDGVFSEVVTLSPTLAQLLLDRNDKNRPISRAAIEKYRRDILVGSWAVNGQTIVVALDGSLNDGQHRCLGVIAANKSVDVVMVFGVERDTRFTLDQGVVRTVGHYLGMNGVENANIVGAVAAYVWQYKTLGRLSKQTYERPTKAENLRIVEHYAGIAESVAFIPGKGSLTLGGKSLLAFCHFALFQASDESTAGVYINRLLDGVGLSARSPILYVRNRLIESKRMTPNEKAELIFRGWNAHRRGEHPKTLPIMGGKLPKLER